jgi:microfibrillar-associated protein 1
MSTQPRKPAPRLARPAQRYWKGKAPKGVVEAASESESEEGDEREEQIPGDVPFDGDEEDDDEVGVPKELKGAGTKSMNVALRDVKLEGGKVIVGGRMESGRTEMEDGRLSFIFRIDYDTLIRLIK